MLRTDKLFFFINNEFELKLKWRTTVNGFSAFKYLISAWNNGKNLYIFFKQNQMEQLKAIQVKRYLTKSSISSRMRRLKRLVALRRHQRHLTTVQRNITTTTTLKQLSLNWLCQSRQRRLRHLYTTSWVSIERPRTRSRPSLITSACVTWWWNRTSFVTSSVRVQGYSRSSQEERLSIMWSA